jgi:phage terminase small subunit
MPAKGGPPNNPKGGARTTTALKKLRGSLNVTIERRRPGFEPQPEIDISTEPPHYLNDLEQEEYRWAVNSAPRGMLKDADHRLVVAWAKVNARYREASRQNDIPTQFNCELMLIKLSDKLGFNPTTRPRIHMLPGKLIEGVALSSWDRAKVLHASG